MLNACHFIGRLTKDPEKLEGRQRTTARAVIAVKKRVKPLDGGKDATFITLVAFGPLAEYLLNRGMKGRLLTASGRLESRQFTTDSGEHREVFEIHLDEVSLLDRPRDDE